MDGINKTLCLSVSVLKSKFLFTVQVIDFLRRQAGDFRYQFHRKPFGFHGTGIPPIGFEKTLGTTFCSAFLQGISFCHEIVAIDLDALVILDAILLGKGGDVHNVLQALKDSLAEFEWHSLQRIHILQYIYPAFKIGFTRGLLLLL